MPTFVIRRSFDAWQHYAAEIEAESFLEAIEVAKNPRHPKSLSAEWKDDGVQEFEAMQLYTISEVGKDEDPTEFIGPGFEAEGLTK